MPRFARELTFAVAMLGLLGAAADTRAQSTMADEYVVFGDEAVTIAAGARLEVGAIGSNDLVKIAGDVSGAAGVDVAGDLVRIGRSQLAGIVFYNTLRADPATLGTTQRGVALPIIPFDPLPPVSPGSQDVNVPPGETIQIAPGAWGDVRVQAGGTLVLVGNYDLESLSAQSTASAASTLRCDAPFSCTVEVRSKLSLGAGAIGVSGGFFGFIYTGTRGVTVGAAGGEVHGFLFAPEAVVKLRSSRRDPSTFSGNFFGRQVKVGAGARLGIGATCGNGVLETPEQCDPPADGACPGLCQPSCTCTFTGTKATLHSVGPSVINNATSFGIQLFGEDFQPGASVQIEDKASGAVLATLPGDVVSAHEMTALVPAGLSVPIGIQRELSARVVNPSAPPSERPIIGSCAVDTPSSPIACTSDADCPAGAGACLTGKQRFTLFNDLAFLNPSSLAVAPGGHGLCSNNARCQSSAACPGSGACAPKLYITPQQRDELLVFNAGTGAFVDQRSGTSGIQGIPVGDNPFHVEVFQRGSAARAWVVNRFEDAVSIIDAATDVEVARVTGTDLGVPGALRMETEIEFNRARTRAYLSNENLDEVQVLDIAGANLDAPVLLAAIDVGVNPRGMATNTADTRLYVANVQSADVSVVDIEPGSPTEHTVLATIAARATDDIVGGRAEGWEPFVISGRAPRGIVFSDAQNALFLTSIGPQTGPRAGVVQTGGAIINPTITVIDADTNGVVAHVALQIMAPLQYSCTDPELMALDDARNRLFVTCQGSGIIDVLDTAALAAGLPAEISNIIQPVPADLPPPQLSLPAAAGSYSQKVCNAASTSRGVACTTDANCTGCPTTVEGLPITCCAINNPVGLHNGPRGIALSADTNRLYVLNQFTTSVAIVNVGGATPGSFSTTGVHSFPGAFGSNTEQQERRLGQIEFFTDVKKTGVSCATCHIDDHQDGVFFEADVRGPRLRRVLSVRGTRDTPPLLQDQLVPDLMSFTDIVVHAERGGAVPCIPCLEVNGVQQCFGGPGSECAMTSNTENRQNALYAKAITFFPNPNLETDGRLSEAVPLPGGQTGDARRGSGIFAGLGCPSCHPAPLFTIDQLRTFESSSLGQPLRMREVATPVLIPLRERCQDPNRPTGRDGSTGFTVPTLRGIWDTFPLLLSGSAGLVSVGSQPAFSPSCTPGGNGCCAELRSPLNPGGISVPEQHLAVSTKDALRAVLTAPLAVPTSGHGAALGLDADDLNALIAYLRSL